jgi:NAD(P)-dependent dehydrogenase (short-subunit alcohol dehydrogenase family)
VFQLTTEFTEEEYERLFRVNVKQIFQSSQVIIPYIVKHGGCVFVNTSSTGDLRPRPDGVWYCATKAAVSNVLSLGTVLTLGDKGLSDGMGQTQYSFQLNRTYCS